MKILICAGYKKSSKFLGRRRKKNSAYLPYLLVSGEINACVLVSHACSTKCFALLSGFG
jgi:hypothetical protein